MTVRVCIGPAVGERCPTAALTRKTRCRDCERAKDQARGSREERGYDHSHRKQRTAWAPRVAMGTVPCRRCGMLLVPDEPWDLGHPDADCPKPLAPECRACNRATSGRTA